MRIEDRFNAVASDRVGRVIRIHASSLARAKHCHCNTATAPACREADAGQFRIILDAARREIERLRRHLTPTPYSQSIRRGCPPCGWRSVDAAYAAGLFGARAASLGSSAASATTHARKDYAPPAVGDIAAVEAAAKQAAASSPIENYQRITNFGTALDVTA